MFVSTRLIRFPFSSRLTCWILSLFLLMAGCTSQEGREPEVRTEHPIPPGAAVVATEGKPGAELHYPLAGEPRTFNYLAASDSRSKLIAYLTSGTLLEFDARSQEVREGLCRKFELSDDGLSARLELREGIRFSDGTPCTVEDVVFTFESIYAKDSANILKDVLLLEGKPLEVTKLDESAFQLTFPVPFAAAAYVLSTVPVLPRHRFQHSDKRIEEYWTLDTPTVELAGLGPFFIHAHEPGRRTILKHNPHYWKIDTQGTRLPYLDRIVLEYTQDRSAQLLRFKAGELDLLDQLLRPEDLRYLEQDRGVNCQDIGPSSSLALFWFNLNDEVDASTETSSDDERKKTWFADTRFRRAVSYAIGRKAIVQNVYLGLATEALSFIPASNKKWYAPNLDRNDVDLEEAKKLLREAGFSWMQKGNRKVLLDRDGHHVEFRLIARSDDVMGKILAVLHQDLESLGMTVSVQQEEFRAVISRIMRSKDYDAVVMNLDFPVEPTDISNVLLSGGSMHFWNPVQPQPATSWEARIDKLIGQQGRTLNEEKRIALFREIQNILVEERPFIPLVNRNVLVAWQRDLGNLKPANIFPFALWNSWEIYREPTEAISKLTAARH